MERTYLQALERCVRPGSVLLLLGDPNGLRAVAACRAGARRVYVLTSPRSRLQTAVARENGCADRITCLTTMREAAAVQERIDLVLAAGGVIDVPIHGSSLLAWRAIDGGAHSTAATMPGAERVSLGLVNAPDAYGRHVDPWDKGETGWDLEPARTRALNMWSRARFADDQLLTGSIDAGHLDYAVPDRRAIAASAKFEVERDCTAHGIAMWTEVELAEGIVLDARPGSRFQLDQTFFPWPRPVDLRAADRVTIHIRGDALDGASTWSWRSTIVGNRRPPVRFEQSTFYAEADAIAGQLRRRHA
jgi:hypothetical protein